MAIITAGDLSDLYNQRIFRANGGTVTLKKISETDWLLFGDVAEGDSEGFHYEEIPDVVDIGPIVGVISVKFYGSGWMDIQTAMTMNPQISLVRASSDPETYEISVSEGSPEGFQVERIGYYITDTSDLQLGIVDGQAYPSGGFNSFAFAQEFRDNWTNSGFFHYSTGSTRGISGAPNYMTVRPTTSGQTLKMSRLYFEKI